MGFLTRLDRRHRQPEIMDDPSLAPDRHRLALNGLERINRWSSSGRMLWRPLAALARENGGRLRALDVASGAGDFARWLWQRGQKEGLALEVEGCDISPTALDYAQERALSEEAQVRFFKADVLNSPLPVGFDAVT